LDLDYLRLLSLVILLPAAIKLASRRENARLLKIPADKYLLAYLVLQLVIQSQVTSFTDLLRSICTLFIDVFLPYYVFSRGLSDRRGMQDVFASFAAACTVMALIGVFELLKGWLLYSSLPAFLDVRWGYGHYLARDGALRATVSTGHPIVFGYVMTVALGLHMAVRAAYPSAASWRNVAVLLGGGIAVSLSRGPWIGAVVMLALATALAPRPAVRIGKITVTAVLLVPVLMFTPYGSKVIGLLPFIGTVDAETVTYRQQLFNVAWDVVMMNPFFGSPYYQSSGVLEQMRQGEGIIDIVNSYLGIALVTGFVGLALFVLVFASSARSLLVYLARHEDKMGAEHVMGRSLLATIVGVLTILATASSINAIPVVYWCLAGACAAYVRYIQAASYDEVPPSPQRKPGFRAASS
jgi:hypothetical protein